MTRREFTRTWTPVSLSGGHRAGTCMDHRNRKSVLVNQNGRWIDTGLCATDFAKVERADRMVARVAATVQRALTGTPRRRRPANPDALAGEIGRSRSRVTHTTAIVIDATMPGADGNVDPTEARWWVICNEHGGIVTTPTRRLAFSAAVDPSEWCPTCQNGGVDPADDAVAEIRASKAFGG